MTSRTNLILIGMPGAGKSTVGVLLAKATSLQFLDTDVLIQSEHGCRLADLIANRGLEAFRRIEEDAVAQMRNPAGAVIATGGSVVYSDRAMRHLQEIGRIIYLNVDLPVLEKRIGNIVERGVVVGAGQSLASLYAERCPLYEQYADITVVCGKKSMEDIVDEIVHKVVQLDSNT